MSENNLKFVVDLRNSDSGFSEEFELAYENISSEIIARILPNQSEDHWKNLFFELFDNAEMGMTSTEGLLFEKARQSLTNMAFDKLGWSDVIVQFTGIEINGTSLLNRVKSSLKKIPIVLTGAEIEKIRLTSTQINNQLLTLVGSITVGLVAALLIDIVNLDSELITSITTSIISVDIALLFSKIVASHENR